ncbi:MAG: DUF3311 domain-containing protein [Nocardioidaceae bacterium]
MVVTGGAADRGVGGPAAGEPRGPRRTTGAWVTVAGLLGVGIVVPLLVFVYDREEPTLLGFPFFYWFQFMMIPIVSAMTFTAFRISEAAKRKDRERFGLPATPSDDQEATS